MKKMLKKSMVFAAVIWALMACVAVPAFATALTEERNTPSRMGVNGEYTVSLTVASNVIIYAGSIVCVNSSGYAVPAADSASYSVVGKAMRTVDNRTAVYKATRTIEVRRGIFRWANADTIVAADIGKIVYVTDDQTCNKTGGGQNIIAGTVFDVDSDGVWVDTGKVGPIGAATPSSLAVSGAATVGSTLAVSGASTLASVGVTGAATVGTTLGVTGVATFTATPVFSTEAAVDGKWATVGPDATTGLMIQTTNVTMHAGTVWTNTWLTSFANGSTPIVVGSYTEEPGDVRPLFVLSSASNVCTVTVTADKNFNLIGIGARP